MASLGCGLVRFDGVDERLRSLLVVTADLVGDPMLADVSYRDIGDVRRILSETELAVSDWMAGDRDEADQSRVVLNHLSEVRAEVNNYEVVRRHGSLGALDDSLRRLRAVSTVEELTNQVPREVAALGFDRVLFSWFKNRRWVPAAIHTVNGPGEALAILRASQPPYRPVGALIESEMVKRRRSIIVHDALNNPHVHQDLQAVLNSRSYVAAPVIGPGTVVGFLHADLASGKAKVDSHHQDVLSVVAEGIGLALDRLLILQELEDLRSRFDQRSGALRALLDDFDGNSCSAVDLEDRTAVSSAHRSTLLGDLTRREYEVLELVEKGYSNSVIAARLYVSEGTVKTHMKNLMRKLGTDSRMQAASLYRREVGAA
ncbi:LuxR C-terminal-related transcriptional regulator [Rhodococcus erythropolis]|uniref:LuxR C-terminal-related transcriptional regulator n=1 Tax=Rhodococcus erythropolis TaxID=1833 RepID=A0AAX3ZXC2_RHOER|nr:LuxR C-terminal-related transcriptional regulator [Rhodococcus erythropolis]WMN01708.1 LuxR C-terminal-related transcriptional regulator [Rhodococcus erythropolis]